MVTTALSCIVSDITRYIGGKSLFFILPLHSTPSLGGPRRSITIPYRLVGKTRMVCFADGEKNCGDMLATSTEYRRMTDGRTDRYLA